MSSHKPQNIWERPPFLIYSSAVTSGIWCLARLRSGRVGKGVGPIRRQWEMRQKVNASEVKKETSVISAGYSFMPASSLWGFTGTCGCKSDRPTSNYKVSSIWEPKSTFTSPEKKLVILKYRYIICGRQHIKCSINIRQLRLM